MVLGEPTGSLMDEPTRKAAEMLRRFFAKHLSPDRLRRVTLFGISLLYDSQVGCASLLARCLAEWFPGVPIVAGGPFASKLSREGGEDALSHNFDAIVIGEGENILARLCQEVPFSGGAQKKRPWLVDTREPVSCLPIPSFHREDLPLYWGRPLTLPIQASRGCYWGRCAFCSYRECYSGPYRCMSPAAVVGTIKMLQEAYGCNRYQLVDDCASPGFLSRFADALASMPVLIRWSASLRFEPQFDLKLLTKLAQAGCRRLTFGMETVSQRLLDYVRKGTQVENYLPILKACKEANIEVHLNWIAGLPGETPEELGETVRFLSEHSDLYSHQFGHVFTLEPGSPFAIEPELFGPPADTAARPFQSAAEKMRLYAVISSLSHHEERQPAPRIRIWNNQPLRWSSTVTKEKVSYDLPSLQDVARMRKGYVNRLEVEEWLIYDPWNELIMQLSNGALFWIESRLGKWPIDDEAREVLKVLHEQGFLE